MEKLGIPAVSSVVVAARFARASQGEHRRQEQKRRHNRGADSMAATLGDHEKAPWGHDGRSPFEK